MKLLYLPALRGCCSELYNRWTSSPLSCLDVRLQGTTAFHPYALCSYYYFRRQRFEWEPEHVIFGDSGGFSVRTRGARIEPQDALRWQLRYCRLGVLLDSPPWNRWDEWDYCLACTVAATKAALPLYRAARQQGSAFRWWGVVHGRTMEELEQWWRAISKIYPFTDDGEGWAFKPHPLNDPEAMRLVLEFIECKGNRRAHFFASAGYNAVETLCCYGPRSGLEWASVDSTSTTMDGAMRLLRMPIVGNRAKMKMRDDALLVRRYMVEQCRCVSCDLLRQDVREQPDLVPEEPGLIRDSIYLKERMIFHNTLVLLDEFESLRRRYAGETSSTVR